MTGKVIIIGKAFCRLSDYEIRLYEAVGEWLAKEKLDAITGSCPGVAYLIGKKIIENGGRVIGYSPAHNLRTHKNVYRFPTDGCSSISYEDKKLLENESFFHRSVRMFMCNKKSIVISFNGGRGTFSELCTAFFMSRTIILATFTGGTTTTFFYFSKLLRIFNLGYGSQVIKARSVTELKQIVLSLTGDVNNDTE